MDEFVNPIPEKTADLNAAPTPSRKVSLEERTLFRGSSSILISLGGFVLGTLVLVAAIAFALVNSANQVASLVLWGVAAIALLYMAIQWLLIRRRVYEVTTERIRVSTGILTRRTEEMELYRVADITLVEPFLQRMLGFGSLHMSTNDASTPHLALEGIKGARKLREELRHSVEICRDRKRVRVAEIE